MGLILIPLVFVLSHTLDLESYTDHQRKIDFAENNSHPYQIQIKRETTDIPESPYNCRAVGRTISYNKSEQLFRLDTHLTGSSDRQLSVLKNLMLLNLDEQILNFEVSNEDYYVITTANKVYFLKHDSGDKYFPPTATNLPETSKDAVQKGDFFLLVIEHGVAIMLAKQSYVCHGTQCSYITGWQPLLALTHAVYTKANNGRQYIMITYLTGFSIMQYTGNGMVTNIKNFDHTFFNKTVVNLYDINAENINSSEIFVLDFEEGVYIMRYQHNDPTQIREVKRILNISRCFSMDNQGFKYFVLICRSPIDQSDYLVEVHYNAPDDNFIGRIPDNQQFQKIVDVELTQNYYVSWAKSGFKFYWTSLDIQYPDEFRKAGSLIFYNTIQARFKTFNNQNYLYYATSNSVQRLLIQQTSPYVTCISSESTKEVYNIRYAVACKQNSSKVCTQEIKLNYEATKHAQISITFGIIPFVLSILGLILIIVIIIVVFYDFKKKQKEIIDKTQTSIAEVNDLGDMLGSARN